MPNDLEYVVKDALMMCDKGATPAPFTPTYNTNVKISGCLVTTKADKIPIVNIPTFGACTVRSGNPCTPVPIDWTDTYKVKVKGQETIIYKSKLPCGTGGKIEFITSGQVKLPPEEYDKLMEEHGEKDEGWGWWDTAELIPVIGNVIGMVREAKKGNWGMFALNVGFLILDVATLGTASLATSGVKGTVKAGAKAVAKATTKAGAKKLVKEGAKAFAKGAAKAVDNIALKTGKVCVFACFTAGTKVSVKEGYKDIEHIQVGDLVWAYNEKTCESDLKPVVSTMENEVDATVQITLGNEIIETTAEHPFYTQTGWKDAADLTISDEVKNRDGKWQRVEASNFLYSKQKVYNFEVADWHTYFVGIWSWLVHNARPCLSQIKHLPQWLARMQKGNYYNFIREQFYKRLGGFNEVVLSTGKRLDSYIPGLEIISRKFTQLGRVTEKTAKKYIDEMVEKYAPGTLIRNTTRNADAIAQGGKELAGEMILEVPKQTYKISNEVLEHATENMVKIRDVTGEILNPF